MDLTVAWQVLEGSLEGVEATLQQLCDAVREDCAGIDISVSSSAVGIWHLQVNSLRVMDFSFMAAHEYEEVEACSCNPSYKHI